MQEDGQHQYSICLIGETKQICTYTEDSPEVPVDALPLLRFKTVPKAKIDENLHDQDDKCLVFFCELYVSMRESAVEVWLRRVVTRWTSIIIDYP
jgi:hypothetical protein